MSVVTGQFSVIFHQLEAGVSSMAMTLGNTVALVKEFAGVAALAGALIAATGVTVSPPWATRADVEKTQKTIETIQTQQTEQIEQTKSQQCIILQLLKDRYLKEQADAQEELNKNPTSPTLQRVRDEAASNVAKLNAKLSAPPCV